MRATDAATANGTSWQDAGRTVWEASDFPTDEEGLRRLGLGYFDYRVAAGRSGQPVPTDVDLETLIEAGIIAATPIVYEDFLPRSAAGIFQSNLVGGGAMAGDTHGTSYGIEWLEATLGCPVHIPENLYAAQSDRSLHACCAALGLDPAALRPDHRNLHITLENNNAH